MKRSDFLKQLYIDVDVAIDSGTDENMVDLIIRRAEELGMLAPPSVELLKSNCRYCGNIKDLSRWEDEDET